MNDHFDFDSQPPSSVPYTGKHAGEDELISDLLKRQDDVLERLDELNSRIENAILEIGKSRQSLDSPSLDSPSLVQMDSGVQTDSDNADNGEFERPASKAA